MLTLVLPGALVPPTWLKDPQWAARLDAHEAARRLARSFAAHATADQAAAPGALPHALPHETWLARRFNLEHGAAWHAASAHADGVGDAAWRVDPVHLRAGLDHVALSNMPAAELSPGDARALADVVQPLLVDHGMTLVVGPEGRWYLRADALLQVTTSTPLTALGRSIEAYLPAGPDARRWRRLVTEIEMTLHVHPVNEARERAGKLPINSLWLTGPVPQPVSSDRDRAPQPSVDSLLIGADASLWGVANLLGHGARAGSTGQHDAASAVSPAGRTLQLVPDLLRARLAGDADGWLAVWEEVTAGALSDAIERLDGGQIDTLEVIATGESRVSTLRLARSDRWRLWRAWRKSSLGAQWVDAA